MTLRLDPMLAVVVRPTMFGRSIGSVQQFLCRVLPRGQWPWTERPRWAREEIPAVQSDRATLPTRTSAAVKEYRSRRCPYTSDDSRFSDELERHTLTVTQVAADLGVSAHQYRRIDRGARSEQHEGLRISSAEAVEPP